MDSPNKELWYAVQKDDIHSAKAALDKGADPNYGDSFAGEFIRLLLYATKWCCPEIIQLLLEHGADVHTVDDAGETALHLATLGNNQDVIDILISYGASPSKINIFDQTPSDIAKSEGHTLENLVDCQGPSKQPQRSQWDLMPGSSWNLMNSWSWDLMSGSSRDLIDHGGLDDNEACGYRRIPLCHTQHRVNQVDPTDKQLPSLQSQLSVVSQEGGNRYINNKGRILVFNYTKFNNPKKNRTGAEEDNNIIENTFRGFAGKYEVIICESYTTEETLLTFENLQHDDSLKDVDSLIIFISSHGDSRNVFHTRDGMIDINDLRSKLYETSEGCLYLKGKPKILIANYCQGQAVEEPVSAAVGETSELSRTSERGAREREKKSVPRNMKTIFSTSDGVVAWRKRTGGNYFLQTFCKVLIREPGLELQRLIYQANLEVEEELGCNSTFSEEGSRFNYFCF